MDRESILNISIGQERLVDLSMGKRALAVGDFSTCESYIDNFLLSINEEEHPDIAKKITESFDKTENEKKVSLVNLEQQIKQEHLNIMEANDLRKFHQPRIMMQVALEKLRTCWDICTEEGLFNES